MTASDNLQRARRYLSAIEQGATGDALASFCDDGLMQFEYPNRLLPQGATRDLAGVLEGAERGQRVVRDQRYQIHDTLCDGERVAMRVSWSATLKIPLGSKAAGDRLEAEFGMFLTFREGRIVEHHTYDCFQPF